MHEWSVCGHIMTQVTDIVHSEKVAVKSLTVSIGVMSGVDKACLEFAWDAMKQGTWAEKATLVIEEVPLEVLCRECQKKSMPLLPFLHCLHCHSTNVEIIAGRDLLLQSLEVCDV